MSFEDNQGEIDQIIEYRVSHSTGLHEVLVEWKQANPSWEPLQSLYKDVPQLLTDFFKSVGQDISDILEIESQALRAKYQSERGYGRGRGGSNYDSTNQNFRGSYSRGRGGSYGGQNRGGFGRGSDQSFQTNSQTNSFGNSNYNNRYSGRESSNRSSYGDRNSQQEQRNQDNSQGPSQQQQQWVNREEFDPKTFRRMMRSRAADRKIQQWENQNTQGQSQESQPKEQPKSSNSSFMMEESPVRENPSNIWSTKSHASSQDTQMRDSSNSLAETVTTSPRISDKLWGSRDSGTYGASDQASTFQNVNSIQDFYKHQKFQEKRQKMQQALELQRQKQAVVEKQEVIQRVLDQPLKDYSKSTSQVIFKPSCDRQTFHSAMSSIDELQLSSHNQTYDNKASSCNPQNKQNSSPFSDISLPTTTTTKSSTQPFTQNFLKLQKIIHSNYDSTTNQYSYLCQVLGQSVCESQYQYQYFQQINSEEVKKRNEHLQAAVNYYENMFVMSALRDQNQNIYQQ
eukprot:403346973